MASKTNLSIGIRDTDRDLRDRLARVRVLVADRDIRTAGLVQRILFSFGLRTIDLVTSGEETLERLRTHPYDFLITEWNMQPMDGVALVRAIRSARDDKRIRRDIPIILMTANAELDSVQAARDAGITEFVAKPFSAAAISSRIIQILDNPRAFVESPGYVGPCRRRRDGPPPGVEERRKPRTSMPESTTAVPPAVTPVAQSPAAAPTLSEEDETAIAEALLASQGDYVDWARRELEALKQAFGALEQAPASRSTQQALLDAAYAVQKQAILNQYDLGAQVAERLVNFVTSHLPPNEKHMLVIAKHIEATSVTFNQNVQQYGHSIARDLIESLGKLVKKLQ